MRGRLRQAADAHEVAVDDVVPGVRAGCAGVGGDELDDPSGQGEEVVRPLRDAMETRVRELISDLAPR